MVFWKGNRGLEWRFYSPLRSKTWERKLLRRILLMRWNHVKLVEKSEPYFFEYFSSSVMYFWMPFSKGMKGKE